MGNDGQPRDVPRPFGSTASEEEPAPEGVSPHGEPFEAAASTSAVTTPVAPLQGGQPPTVAERGRLILRGSPGTPQRQRAGRFSMTVGGTPLAGRADLTALTSGHGEEGSGRPSTAEADPRRPSSTGAFHSGLPTVLPGRPGFLRRDPSRRSVPSSDAPSDTSVAGASLKTPLVAPSSAQSRGSGSKPFPRNRPVGVLDVCDSSDAERI